MFGRGGRSWCCSIPAAAGVRYTPLAQFVRPPVQHDFSGQPVGPLLLSGFAAEVRGVGLLDNREVGAIRLLPGVEELMQRELDPAGEQPSPPLQGDDVPPVGPPARPVERTGVVE